MLGAALILAAAVLHRAELHAQEPGDPPAGPGLTVSRVEIRGVADISPPVRLPRRVPLRPGTPYTADRVEQTEQAVLAALAESGRPFATVEISAIVDHAAGTAAVALQVDPGPIATFGQIALGVPPPLRESDIRARVRYAPGDLFRPSLIERTRQAILALPGVAGVVVETRASPGEPDVVATVIRVARPDRFHDLSGRGSLSSFDCLELAATWRHQHFLGGPRALAVSGGFSNLFASVLDGGFPCAGAGEDAFAQPNYFATASFYQPIGADPATAIQARAFFRRATAPQSYIVHGYGLHLAVLREVGTALNARIAYSPERNELRSAGHYFCINFDACTGEAIARLEDMRWLAPVEASLHWLPPAALQPFGPPGTQEGLWPGALGPLWRSSARGAVAGAAGPTGSDFTYVRGVAEGSLARVATVRTEAAARVRIGSVRGDGEIPPQVRFYSGGANTVRGVAQNLLGPLVLVARPDEAVEAGCEPVQGGCPPHARPAPDRVSVRPRGGSAVAEANIEGRLWLTPSFQLAAFADGGVLGDGFDGRLEGIVTPGLGFRWLTRLGPVRVDVGYDPRPARMVPVLLQVPDQGLIPLGDVVWAPHTHDGPGAWRELWRRLQIHLALGQPF
jgi:outer membrane protein assembly factor BamA